MPFPSEAGPPGGALLACGDKVESRDTKGTVPLRSVSEHAGISGRGRTLLTSFLLRDKNHPPTDPNYGKA